MAMGEKIVSALTIIAIILGPILAVQIQKLIERITQKRDEKRRVLMVLMATRDRRILPEHVQALNMIDIVFSGKGKKDMLVVEAWAEYRDHLNSYPHEPSGKKLSDTEQAALQSKRDTWVSKATDLLVELIAKMAESLNYHFDKVLLKKGAYTPSGFGEDEVQRWVISRGLTEVFLGTKSIPIRIVEVPPIIATESSQKASNEKTETDA